MNPELWWESGQIHINSVQATQQLERGTERDEDDSNTKVMMNSTWRAAEKIPYRPLSLLIDHATGVRGKRQSATIQILKEIVNIVSKCIEI